MFTKHYRKEKAIMRCIDGLCGDDACWYCARKRTPTKYEDEYEYDGDPMHGDEYEGLIENDRVERLPTREGGSK
jgi:hypothetical protein